MLQEVGLVLEGGGMRGLYTAGVLESFLDHDVYFPYVIGVSAGAGTAASYLSKQKGRNKVVNINYIKDPRYLSWSNMIKHRQFFGMDFIFDEIPNKLVPFDYEQFSNNPAEFVIVTTDCMTGEPVYFRKEDYGKDMLTILKASSSLPFAAPEVYYKNHILLDGGVSDSVPIKKAKLDGFNKNVVILTRNRGYVKKPSKFAFLVKRKYPQYPGLQQALMNRYRVYNETTRFLEEEEAKGNIIIIRPDQPVEVGRLERNSIKLEKLYEQGYNDGKKMISKISKWDNI